MTITLSSVAVSDRRSTWAWLAGAPASCAIAGALSWSAAAKLATTSAAGLAVDALFMPRSIDLIGCWSAARAIAPSMAMLYHIIQGARRFLRWREARAGAPPHGSYCTNA
ncbi:hypothetical protein G6F31_020809 [Rhizopus arrhizus]|nr:hypothetical protein G6F31_020809 [Rhizopus arrhizus]